MIYEYQSLYANGLNNNTQLRRSTDMIYQRGGTYEVVLDTNEYHPSMELDVDIFVEGSKVGRFTITPYEIKQGEAISYLTAYTYKFNIRPYDYISNYVQSEHYQFYWLNDWYKTTQQINLNNPYPNSVEAFFLYGWRYESGGIIFQESTEPGNYLNHYTDIPACNSDTSFTPSGFTNTGPFFNYVGGAFQFDNNFILQNFDQEIGTVAGSGLTINTIDVNRRLSPMSQYLLDYPTVPEQSETARFLTDAPRIQYIQSDENYVLYYLNGQTGDRQVIEADFAVFEFYDEGNNQIDYVEQQLNFVNTIYASPTGFTDTLQPFALPCGPKDILNIFSQIDFTDVAYYRVQLFYGYPTNVEYRTSVGPVGPVSEGFYFYLYDNCKPQNTRLAFLNDRGGYDYFTFTAYRQDKKKITRQTYDSRYYATNLSSPDRNIGRSVKTFATDVDQEIVLETDYLSVPVGQWIEQLFYSPQVYIVKPDFISPIDRQDKVYKDLTPVQILSTEVETITEKHKKLNKYRITMKTADTFFVNKGF
jgi:hypothetical protein